jgi:hypothetical protein
LFFENLKAFGQAAPEAGKPRQSLKSGFIQVNCGSADL